MNGGAEDDAFFEEVTQADAGEVSLDSSAHNILQVRTAISLEKAHFRSGNQSELFCLVLFLKRMNHRVWKNPQFNEHNFTSINSPSYQAIVDPVAWKTELERVGPKLRAQQQLSTNEWRAHVDQTVANNQHIEKVLEETQSDLQIMNKYVLVFV